MSTYEFTLRHGESELRVAYTSQEDFVDALAAATRGLSLYDWHEFIARVRETARECPHITIK